MSRLVGLAALTVILGTPGVAPAHHVGAFVPKDTEISANFKQIKFSIQAGKFDVALKLFDEGALHAEMEKLEGRLPGGLEDGLRAALKARDARGAEVRLMVFMAFIARDLAREAERRIADSATAGSVRAAQTAKLLEAVWRYYNLVDFVVSQRDVKAALGLRLAFEDAESAVGGSGSDPMKGGGNRPATIDLARAREALARMSGILTGVIEQSIQSALAVPAGAGVPRP